MKKTGHDTVSRQDTCLETPSLPSAYFGNPNHTYTHVHSKLELQIWANAQRDGRPA